MLTQVGLHRWNPPPREADAGPYLRGLIQFAHGMAYAARGDIAAAQAELESLQRSLPTVRRADLKIKTNLVRVRLFRACSCNPHCDARGRTATRALCGAASLPRSIGRDDRRCASPARPLGKRCARQPPPSLNSLAPIYKISKNCIVWPLAAAERNRDHIECFVRLFGANVCAFHTSGVTARPIEALVLLGLITLTASSRCRNPLVTRAVPAAGSVDEAIEAPPLRWH